jgi:FKBP-type peptidyl-prolyl cis-trans isomerase
MRKLLFLIPALMLTFAFSACNDKGYQTTETGLVYKFHEKNRGDKPAIDNYVKIDFAYRYPEDSVFFSSQQNGMPGFIKIQPSGYEGDIYEGLRMMSVGDSASFKFGAESFFTITAGSPMIPPFIQPDDSIFVDIILHEFFDEEGYQAYLEKEREEMMKEQEIAAAEESKILDEYLAENNITTEPQESGLIIIVEEEGTGPKPESGQTVVVHYTGTVLDGTVFDSSVERGNPFEFTLGRGQVIRGWDEGISKLNVGSKAKLIIPSHLAYGDQDRGPVIKAFSTLIFDIELLEVK